MNQSLADAISSISIQSNADVSLSIDATALGKSFSHYQFNLNAGGSPVNAVLGAQSFSGSVSIENNALLFDYGNNAGAAGIRGVSNTNGNVSIVNSGSISVTGVESRGIDAQSNGAGNVSVVNSGVVSSEGDGISASSEQGGTVFVDNRGVIATVNGDGIEAWSGSDADVTVINSGQISVAGSGSTGIDAWSDSGGGATSGTGTVIVRNSAAIVATGPFSSGITAGTSFDTSVAGSSVTITTSADITANGADSYGILGVAGSSGTININVENGVTVQGGSGATQLGVASTVFTSWTDANGNTSYNADNEITGAAGVLIAGGSNNVINNAGTISAANGLAISTFSGTLTMQEYDYDNWVEITTAPPIINETVTIAAGNETVNNSGTINGDVSLGGGNDAVTNTGTINGNVDLGSGDDTLTLSSGSINGIVDGGTGNDTLISNGGTVNGTINFEIVGFDADSIILDGADLSANNISFNGTQTQTVHFSGGGDVSLLGGASVALSGGTHAIAANTITVGSASTLRIHDGDVILLDPGNIINSRLSLSGTLDMQDAGSNFHQLTVGVFDPSSATLKFDFNGTTGDHDSVVVTGTSTPVGTSSVHINNVGGDPADQGRAGLVVVSGETVPAVPQLGENVHSSYQFASGGDPSSSLVDYSLQEGSRNGLYMVYAPKATGDTVPEQGLNQTTSKTQQAVVSDAMDQVMQNDIHDLADSADVSEAGESERSGGSSSSSMKMRMLSPSFGVWSTGRAGVSSHDGYGVTSQVGGVTSTSRSANFDTRNFSMMSAAAVNVSKLADIKAVGLKAGVFGGWATTEIDIGTNSALTALGIANSGSGTNESWMAGAYGVVSLGKVYGVGTVSGSWGKTEITNNVIDTLSDYNTVGFSTSFMAGTVIPAVRNGPSWAQKVNIDLRAGYTFSTNEGAAHLDSNNNQIGKSELEQHKVSASAMVFVMNRFNGVMYSPFAQFGIDHNVKYDNTAIVGDTLLKFSQNDSLFYGKVGLTVFATKYVHLYSNYRLDLNNEQKIHSLQLGGKIFLN